MMHIFPILAFEDNYIWILFSSDTKCAVVVDPGMSLPVIAELEHRNLTLAAILVTHHHYDHTRGIPQLLAYQDVPVYGPSPFCHKANDITISDLNVTFSVLSVPGHTQDHLAYAGQGYVFCGDTLFTGGCGRLFDGTPVQMFDSLRKLKTLPKKTLVYCGHEYTESNLQFAQIVEPANSVLKHRIQIVKKLTNKKKPTVPASLSLELATNPFLRTRESSVCEALQQQFACSVTDEVERFIQLRRWKDNF